MAAILVRTAWELGGAGLGLGLPLGLVLALGCGDGSSDPPGPGDDTEAAPSPTVDYAQCDRSLQDPTCEGVGCGVDPQAQQYLQVMLDVVAEAGLADHFAPTRAEHFPLTNELVIDYQLQVGWFRVASSLPLDVPDRDEILRQELAAIVSGWEVPAMVATPEQISAAIEACDVRLSYDPCEDHRVGFVVHHRDDGAPSGCVGSSSYAVVDARDATLLECVEAPPCG